MRCLRHILAAMFFTGLVLPLFSQDPSLSLVPWPTKVKFQPGHLSLDGPITVACTSRDPKVLAVATTLSAAVTSELGVAASGTRWPAKATFVLATAFELRGEESYHLDIKPRQVRLAASTPTGLFYGVQTLRQLLFQARESRRLPCLSLVDQPRFPWRGMHLDVSRHFFPASFIKRYLDVLALHKLNVFHWHLTDDHGWRIEIKRYPKLTSVGAWREPKDGNDWIYAPQRSMDPAERTYGGFYTQDEVREIVRYAAALHIRVIPEIEMPAHSMAAMEAYPELSCSGRSFVASAVVNEATEFTDPYCAGNEAVFTFLEGVLTEVMGLFPDRDLHLGADEARKTTWKACPKCQSRMRELNLKDEEALQSWFMKRMTGFLARHKKRAIGWDELAQGGMPEGTMMMHWRSWLGEATVIQAAKMGHDVVRTPIDSLYFRPIETLKPSDTVGPGLPEYLARILRFQPVPPALSKTEAERIKGVEGCIWTEDIPTEAILMRTLLPSLSALSEMAWHDSGNSSGFAARLSSHLKFLDACRHGTCSASSTLIPGIPGPDHSWRHASTAWQSGGVQVR
jgi:hexosaminidase